MIFDLWHSCPWYITDLKVKLVKTIFKALKNRGKVSVLAKDCLTSLDKALYLSSILILFTEEKVRGQNTMLGMQSMFLSWRGIHW